MVFLKLFIFGYQFFVVSTTAVSTAVVSALTIAVSTVTTVVSTVAVSSVVAEVPQAAKNTKAPKIVFFIVFVLKMFILYNNY